MKLIKVFATVVIVAAISIHEATAGQWSYRCDFYSGAGNCDQLSDAAKSGITGEFTDKYSNKEYIINFTVSASSFSSSGQFIYTVIASLHRKDGRMLEFPSIASHSSSGFNSGDPTYALQRQHIMNAAKKAAGNLVSDVMDN